MSHLVPKFLGHVQGGRVKIIDADLYLAHIKKLENRDVYVTVQKVRNIRSNQQLNYYFGVVVKLLSEHTGYEAEEMHEILKSKFGPIKKVQLGGKAEIIRGCTHDLYKDNFFEEYVDLIRRWASAELGVVIPDPPQVEP